MDQYAEIRAGAEYIMSKTAVRPKLGLVLGSGWNLMIQSVQNATRVGYDSVPGMHASTVPGHAGEWVIGEIGSVPVLIMSGRLHYYEGHSLFDVTKPVRMMKEMGVTDLVLTNAAGAINTSFDVGDLMLITDHINMTGNNPLIGKNLDEYGPRFPDMSVAYDMGLRALARHAANKADITLREGVYAQMTGPSFESPAEIRMLRTLGADAVGMSTVPEAVVARHAGMRVLGLSCMTNMAAGVLNQPLSHEEVMATARASEGRIRGFMETVIAEWAKI